MRFFLNYRSKHNESFASWVRDYAPYLEEQYNQSDYQGSYEEYCKERYAKFRNYRQAAEELRSKKGKQEKERREEAEATDDLSILEEDEVVKRRDGKVRVTARKCKCGSVWCPECSKLKWVPRMVDALSKFDWRRTRELVLTCDREAFKDGEEAFTYAQEHQVVRQFIRNLIRGCKEKIGKKWEWKYRPVKITNWRWFVEWHKDGFSHWHVFIETEKAGPAAMIGGDMVRHYWPLARWVKETYFKSERHWRNQVGYFGRNGYFHKDKRHQTRLPEWAMDKPGLRIRRSDGYRFEKESDAKRIGDYFDRMSPMIVDKRTGEIRKWKGERSRVVKTYRERLEACGKRTWMKIVSAKETIKGLFAIPYKEIRNSYEGEFKRGLGYIFEVASQRLGEFLEKCEKVESYKQVSRPYWRKEKIGFLRSAWCLRFEQGAA